MQTDLLARSKVIIGVLLQSASWFEGSSGHFMVPQVVGLASKCLKIRFFSEIC